MKKIAFIICSFLLMRTNISSQEDYFVKTFPDNIPRTGNEFVLLTKRINTKDLKINQTFEVEVKESGNYYLNAWIMPAKNENGFVGTEIFVDDDTHIFMPQTSLTSKIMVYDYDYEGNGDWNWGNAARIKGTFSPYQDYLFISSESSSDPTGVCDVYFGCFNSSIGYFPNLESDDAIRSADSSTNYNCASWAGGRMDLGRYFWASNPPGSNNLSSDWYVAPGEPPYYYTVEQALWMSWNKYFYNYPSRFSGAPDYTTTGGTSSV